MELTYGLLIILAIVIGLLFWIEGLLKEQDERLKASKK